MLDYTIGEVLITFVALLIIFHLIAIPFECTRSRKLWAWLDYVWLVAATIGLVSAASQATKLFAERDTNMSRWVLEAEHAYALSRARIGQRLFGETYPLDDWEASGDSILAATYKQAAAWYDRLYDSLAMGVEASSWVGFSDSVELGFEIERHSMLSDDIHSTLYILGRMDSLQYIQNRSIVRQERTDLDITLIMLSPWFLAFALAIRLTKVSVSVKGFTKPGSCIIRHRKRQARFGLHEHW